MTISKGQFFSYLFCRRTSCSLYSLDLSLRLLLHLLTSLISNTILISVIPGPILRTPQWSLHQHSQLHYSHYHLTFLPKTLQ